jgi:hypothetical protein
VSPTAVSVAEKTAAEAGVADWLLPPKTPDPVPVPQTAPVAAAPVARVPVVAPPATPVPVKSAPITAASIAAAPATTAPVVAPPVAAAPDPAIARLEQFLVAIQSARASSRISR